MKKIVPSAAPGLRFVRYEAEICAAIDQVLRSGHYILGPETEAFEAEFAKSMRTTHCIGCSSGTDAIALALAACGIGDGDEVLIPALTAPATAVGVLQSGACPRLVDVDPFTRGLDPETAASVVTPKTKAIVVVHLHGTPSEIHKLLAMAQRYNLLLIEDCAHAHGAMVGDRSVGTFGHAAVYSFFPTKNLGCPGDGGCVVTTDSDVARRTRDLRNFGTGAGKLPHRVGWNARPSELQFAILRVLLGHLKQGNRERCSFAAAYDEFLDDFKAPTGLLLPPRSEGSVFHQYAVECDERDALKYRLCEHGIDTGIHYDRALNQHPQIAGFLANSQDERFPVAEGLASRMLSLPIQPELRIYEDLIKTALARSMSFGAHRGAAQA